MDEWIGWLDMPKSGFIIVTVTEWSVTVGINFKLSLIKMEDIQKKPISP